MNKAMLTVGLIFLAVLSLLIINVVQGYQTGSELDYYLLKETTEAAMTDAVDPIYYAENGVIRMDKEKFAESFVRRFADSVDQARSYRIRFYDINEAPPKVSVRVDSSTKAKYNQKGFDKNDIEITTNVDAILESLNETDILTTKLIEEGKLGTVSE